MKVQKMTWQHRHFVGSIHKLQFISIQIRGNIAIQFTQRVRIKVFVRHRSVFALQQHARQFHWLIIHVHCYPLSRTCNQWVRWSWRVGKRECRWSKVFGGEQTRAIKLGIHQSGIPGSLDILEFSTMIFFCSCWVSLYFEIWSEMLGKTTLVIWWMEWDSIAQTNTSSESENDADCISLMKYGWQQLWVSNRP